MDHWTDELTSEKLTTPEAKTELLKYGTAEDAHISHIALQATAGKPFKMPETMEAVEHWPDKNDRDTFHSAMRKLRGGIESADDLKDVNFAEGLPDARMVNDDFKKAASDFAIAEGISKELFPKLIKFNNDSAVKYQAQIDAANDQAAKEQFEKVKGVLEPLYGGIEGVKKQYENVRRMFQNKCGLTAEEYQNSGQTFVEKILKKDPVMSKALMNLAKDIVPEGTTDTTQTDSKPEEGGGSGGMEPTGEVLKWNK